MKDITELIEETSGATLHFYYSKNRSKWVCWYSFKSFFICDSWGELMQKTKEHIVANREEVGRHYRMKDK